MESETSHWQQANRAVIQQNQDRIDKANRRSTSPNSLRCSINTRDFLRLLRETRPGYQTIGGLTLYRGHRKQRISPPLLICYGLQKSASSFIWKIACDIAGGEKLQQLTSRQLPQFLNDRFLQTVDKRSLAIVELLPPDVTYVLKTHGPVSEAVQALVAAGLAKAVVSVRDPYDLVASLMDVGISERARPPDEQRIAFTSIHTIQDALAFVIDSIGSCQGWLEFAEANDFPVIHFEQVKNQPETIATQVADLLGVPIDPAAVVAPFLKNKTENIPEFNVGVSGRGRKLFEGYDNPEVTRVLDGFNNLISKFK